MIVGRCNHCYAAEEDSARLGQRCGRMLREDGSVLCPGTIMPGSELARDPNEFDYEPHPGSAAQVFHRERGH